MIHARHKNLVTLLTKSLQIILLLMSSLSLCQSDDFQFTHHAVLDHHGFYHLFWFPGKANVTFEVQVKTLGYIGLGFSYNGRMKGSDMVMMWMDVDLTPHLDDRHSDGHRSPLIDASQDYTLISASCNDSHTTFRFSRPWNTCDIDDMILGDDTVRVIWATHTERPKSKRHIQRHHKKGVRSLLLRQLLPKTKLGNIGRTWELRVRNVRLPNNDHTHYFCQIFKAPSLDKKHHMIGFEPIIQPGNEPYLHHMVLYECHVGSGDSTDVWFSHHVDAEGAACYSPNMPAEWAFCLSNNAWAWAVGSEGEMLPAHAGVPIGESYGGATYFMLEIHYDNPQMDQDLVDSSGIRILYTDELRQYDTGMILVGSEVNFMQMVPPHQESFTSLGRCTSACTRKGFNLEGIRLINGVLHAHLAAKKIRLRHLRDGVELPVILEDNNYDFNFQTSRRPKGNETVILPGDELLLECEYGTLNRDSPTFGGLSTKQEMCLGFLLYYPRSQLTDCRSLPTLATFMSALGIGGINGDVYQKLSLFMKEIGSNVKDETKLLNDLLRVLLIETGNSTLDASHFLDKNDEAPLTEAELLKKPFYTVVQPLNLYADVTYEAAQLLNYRSLILDLLLKVHIKSPAILANETIGSHLDNINWRKEGVSEFVEDVLYFGPHNSVCLGNGRRALLPYEESFYPPILMTKSSLSLMAESSKCGGGGDLISHKKKFIRKFHPQVHHLLASSSPPLASLSLGLLITLYFKLFNIR